ncbi:hypothetical protein GF325_11615 [Candidatus Bathyarchaeota archaeon]|nr:hypothetical protein [Candidatus Bathyarchaeota archaeon]
MSREIINDFKNSFELSLPRLLQDHGKRKRDPYKDQKNAGEEDIKKLNRFLKESIDLLLEERLENLKDTWDALFKQQDSKDATGDLS